MQTMNSSTPEAAFQKRNRQTSRWLFAIVFVVVCLIGMIPVVRYAIRSVTPLEQCEPLKLLLTLNDLPKGAVVDAVRQPATDSILTSAGVAFGIDGHAVFHRVFWHPAISAAQGKFVDEANFAFNIGANGIKEDIPVGLVLPFLHADESHIGCGMTAIGRVCSFAARYSNIVTWLQVELTSDNQVDEFMHLIEVVNGRLRSCNGNVSD